MVNRNFAIIILCLLILTSCGSGPSSDSAGTGAITFNVEWVGAPTLGGNSGKANEIIPAALDCTASGVATVEATVYRTGGFKEASGGPWSCGAHSGSITNVPTGTNRYVVIFGKDSTGGVVYVGNSNPIDVVNGQTADAGTITADLIVPIVSALGGRGANIVSWNTVTSANGFGYGVYVSLSSGGTPSLLASVSNATSYTHANLPADTTYYYRVLSYSTYGSSALSNEISATSGTPYWFPTSTTNAPIGRSGHTAVWTGTEMIIWGGYGAGATLNSGGRYNPITDTWTPTTTTNAPSARTGHVAVWTGTQMIVWGGGTTTGALYDPATDVWTATTTTNAPVGRNGCTAVWTGSEMIVWGGNNGTGSGNYFNTGGKYNPNTDTWAATSTTGAPQQRSAHTAIWSGSEMIVWGGFSPNVYLYTGGRYNPTTDTWTSTTAAGAPAGRTGHNSVWTGSEMIIWGGHNGSTYSANLHTGGRYNPATDQWTPTAITGAPDARYDALSAWTGTEMIVLGGCVYGYYNTTTGGLYNPNTDSWTATSTAGANIAGTSGMTAVWTGSRFILCSGGAVQYLP